MRRDRIRCEGSGVKVGLRKTRPNAIVCPECTQVAPTYALNGEWVVKFHTRARQNELPLAEAS